MSSQARERIFARLNAAGPKPLTPGPGVGDLPVKTYCREES